jgi:hypothetical protein
MYKYYSDQGKFTMYSLLHQSIVFIKEIRGIEGTKKYAVGIRCTNRLTAIVISSFAASFTCVSIGILPLQFVSVKLELKTLLQVGKRKMFVFY